MDESHRLHGCLPLFRLAAAGADMDQMAKRLLDQAKRNVDAAHALMDLSWIFTFKGQDEMAISTQALALKLQQHYQLSQGASGGLRLLALMAPGDYLANTPVECLIEGSEVALDLLFLGPGLPFPDPLPEHDLLFVAVRESEGTLPILKQIEERLSRQPVPVVNSPSRIPWLARDKVSDLLQTVPGLAMPRTWRVDRQGLQEFGEAGGDFPLIVRPIGSHRGQGLVKLEDTASLAGHLQSVATEAFYVSRFVDYRGPDGWYRKIRIALIDGRPFACHLAISEHWMVNFINAHMEASAWKRAEEAAFMAHFDEAFAPRHAAALGEVHARLRLDYLVMDCAETPDGRLLLFEADNVAIVHANDSLEVFPYKGPQMRKVFGAFRQLLDRLAGHQGRLPRLPS